MTYSLEQTHVRRLALDVVLEGPAVGRLLGEVEVLARDGVGMHLALAVADLGVDDRVRHVNVVFPELARHGLREALLAALGRGEGASEPVWEITSRRWRGDSYDFCTVANGMPRKEAVAPVTMMLPPPFSTIAGVQHWAHVSSP